MLRGMAAGGMLLSASGLLHAAPQPRRGGTLTIATQSSSNADTLDPAKGALSTDYLRAHMFYSGLTSLDAHLAPQNMLAEDIATDDAIAWTIRLRKGVQFHDGKPLTSADVVYSLNRHNDPAVASKVRSVAQQFESVRASGPLTVVITLKGANADLPVILATSHFVIVQDGASNFTTANGTGAFVCKEFTPGVRTIGVRNPRYWKPGLPHLDQVSLFGIPDESARINALLSGDVHWVNEVNPRSTKRIKSEPGYQVLESQGGLYTDLVIRQTVGLGRNPDFTLGMKYLIDREQMKRAAFRGYAVVANDQPIPPSSRFHFAGLPQRPYDPERARYHLRRAGALDLTLPVVASVAATGSVDMGMLLQQSAQKAGLKLALKRVSADGYWSKHWMKSPIGFGNVNARPSADMLFTQFFKSDAPWNESGWNNPQFDQLLLLARAETDEAKRKQLYADMQVLVHEKCGVGIPLFINNLEGYSTKVKGVSSHPLGAFMGYTCPEHVWLDA
ncbi:peptide/nickel transport system substrate-binding protein [Pseudoduganella namucuonensis]|uniref:Peptide/nickel transport system substrate-binding protein n=2 Tax=Pseudoduganella namucuonensis TaxID=1035707 RepID=A0A1I7K1Y0_9BURK|nr:peptide/nickel transport system substrate-binding protein [Pseudoduganella namucuonensis]